MRKRKIFEELMEGISEMSAHREGETDVAKLQDRTNASPDRGFKANPRHAETAALLAGRFRQEVAYQRENAREMGTGPRQAKSASSCPHLVSPRLSRHDGPIGKTCRKGKITPDESWQNAEGTSRDVAASAQPRFRTTPRQTQFFGEICAPSSASPSQEVTVPLKIALLRCQGGSCEAGRQADILAARFFAGYEVHRHGAERASRYPLQCGAWPRTCGRALVHLVRSDWRFIHRVRALLGYFLAHEHRARYVLDSGAHGDTAGRDFGGGDQRLFDFFNDVGQRCGGEGCVR